jgi:hypothetical protein
MAGTVTGKTGGGVLRSSIGTKMAEERELRMKN